MPILQIFALIGGLILWSHGVAARETEIPWKIDEATAQRLAAEGHYGAGKVWNISITTATMVPLLSLTRSASRRPTAALVRFR